MFRSLVADGASVDGVWVPCVPPTSGGNVAPVIYSHVRWECFALGVGQTALTSGFCLVGSESPTLATVFGTVRLSRDTSLTGAGRHNVGICIIHGPETRRTIQHHVGGTVMWLYLGYCSHCDNVTVWFFPVRSIYVRFDRRIL